MAKRAKLKSHDAKTRLSRLQLLAVPCAVLRALVQDSTRGDKCPVCAMVCFDYMRRNTGKVDSCEGSWAGAIFDLQLQVSFCLNQLTSRRASKGPTERSRAVPHAAT